MMGRYSLVFMCFWLTATRCTGQDTIKVGPSVHYSKKEEPYRGKEFASKVEYGREDIVYSDTFKRIEYCYYYDDARVCYGTSYKLKDDSVLRVFAWGDNDEHEEDWIYKKQGDRYFVHRYFDGTYESGVATSLMPFEQIGVFTTTTADKEDILWTSDHDVCRPSLHSEPRYQFYETRGTGKIYPPDSIDNAPMFLNGDSIGEVKLEYDGGCFCEPIRFVKTMTFVITDKGRIINIKQGWGNIELNYCPYYVMDLIRFIYQLGPVKPATRNGTNVNVQWTVKVDMGHGGF